MAPFTQELLMSRSVLSEPGSIEEWLSQTRQSPSDAGSIASSHSAWHSTLLPEAHAFSAVTSLKHIVKPLQAALLVFSDWTVKWTPFTLVVTYYIVSTAIFVMCSAEAVKVFYFFFMVTNFYVAAFAAIESFLGLSPVREARRQAIELENNDCKFPSLDANVPVIDLVIVAYLPNEKDIVKDQVLYALDELVYPADKLRINLVYNTPKPIEPLETELWQMQHKYPQLRVEKVPNSKSKADNLNYFFTLNTGADVIGTYNPKQKPLTFSKTCTDGSPLLCQVSLTAIISHIPTTLAGRQSDSWQIHQSTSYRAVVWFTTPTASTLK